MAASEPREKAALAMDPHALDPPLEGLVPGAPKGVGHQGVTSPNGRGDTHGCVGRRGVTGGVVELLAGSSLPTHLRLWALGFRVCMHPGLVWQLVLERVGGGSGRGSWVGGCLSTWGTCPRPHLGCGPPPHPSTRAGKVAAVDYPLGLPRLGWWRHLWVVGSGWGRSPRVPHAETRRKSPMLGPTAWRLVGWCVEPPSDPSDPNPGV